MHAIDQFLNEVSTYKQVHSDPIELEVRFKDVTYKNFITLLDYLMNINHKVDVNKSVVSIIRRGTDTGLLMELNFPNNGGKIKKIYKEKKIINKPVYDNSMILPFKLTAAYEKQIDACSMDNADIVRIKIRLSFIVDEYPDWSFDLTIMRQITGEDAKSSLTTIIKSMFKPLIEPATVINTLNLEETSKLYSFEIEAEYHGTKELTKNDIVLIVDYIIKSIDSTYIGGSNYNQYLIDIADQIGYKKQLYRYTLKELLPQVELLTKDIYCKNYPPTNLFVTDKADGIRAVLFVKDSEIHVLSSKLTSIDGTVDEDIFIICDCELVGDIAYIFDVIQFNELNLAFEGYESRHTYIDSIVSLLNNPKIAGKKIRNMSSDHISAIDSAMIEDDLYERDGLIFIDGGQPYLYTKTYKWKPLKHTTIDFLVKKYDYAVPTNIKLKDDHDLYFLFNGISADYFLLLGMRTCDNYKKLFDSKNKSYFPIQFSPSTSPYAYIYQHPKDGIPIDGKVVEFRLDNYDVTKLPYLPEWSIVRVRDDRQVDVDSGKYYGNDFRIAEMTWNTFLDPLTVEELKDGCSKSYFMETKGTIYFAQVNVLSFIKERRIEKYANSNWVIDACSGRGADLGRFIRNNIKNLVCIDQDRTALAELVKRKYDFARLARKDRKRDRKPSWGRSKGTSIIIIAANFGDRKQVIQKTKDIIPKEGVNLITCNFAVHYFLESDVSLNNFVMICKDLLKSGGDLVLTFMIGERIFDLLKDVKYEESVDTYDHVIKNSLKKLYTEDTLLTTGQKIGVLLPFSKGEYYEEYLVNTQALIDAFECKGFKCSKVLSVNSSIPDFKHSRPNIYNLLTNDDKWYLDLFGELIITKL